MTRRGIFGRDAVLGVCEKSGLGALVDPLCQASIVGLENGEADGNKAVVFANPARLERENLTVRVSRDGCRSWSAGKCLHQGPAAANTSSISRDRMAITIPGKARPCCHIGVWMSWISLATLNQLRNASRTLHPVSPRRCPETCGGPPFAARCRRSIRDIEDGRPTPDRRRHRRKGHAPAKV